MRLTRPVTTVLVVATGALAIAGGLAASLAGGAPAEHPHADASTTRVSIFQPWSGSGLASGLRVTGRASGSCFTTSLAVDARYAWRCSSGNTILDPCFSPPAGGGSTLACGTPWSGLTLLRLQRPLPAPAPSAGATPPAGWLLRLATGATCSLSLGAAGARDGHAIVYECSGGAASGPLDTSSEPWSVLLLPAQGRPRRVAVLSAWG